MMSHGFHGSDVTLDDVAIILDELAIRTEDAILKFAHQVERNDVGLLDSEDRGIPIWLQHPLSLHDKLSRWLSNCIGPPSQSQDDVGSMLNQSLSRLGGHLNRLSREYVRLRQASVDRTTTKSPESTTMLSREEMAMQISRRRRPSLTPSHSGSRQDYTCQYDAKMGNIQTWDNGDMRRMQCQSVADDMEVIQNELHHLKEITERLAREVNDQQCPLDTLEASTTNVAVVTQKVNQMLRKMARARHEWIPLGATMGGVGIGLLAGTPGGVVGVALGAIIGGATFGSAATVIMEPTLHTDEGSELQRHPNN